MRDLANLVEEDGAAPFMLVATRMGGQSQVARTVDGCGAPSAVAVI
jgi:hypothetical protein